MSNKPKCIAIFMTLFYTVVVLTSDRPRISPPKVEKSTSFYLWVFCCNGQCLQKIKLFLDLLVMIFLQESFFQVEENFTDLIISLIPQKKQASFQQLSNVFKSSMLLKHYFVLIQFLKFHFHSFRFQFLNSSVYSLITFLTFFLRYCRIF